MAELETVRMRIIAGCAVGEDLMHDADSGFARASRPHLPGWDDATT